jgi:hypothetical protein
MERFLALSGWGATKRFFIGHFDQKMFHWPSHWLNKWEICDQTQTQRCFYPGQKTPWK